MKAQEQINWGENPSLAKEIYAKFSKDLNEKNYFELRKNLFWLLNYTPQHSKQLYQEAEVIYRNLAKLSNDEQTKMIYQDSLLLVFDLRIKYFGEKEMVLKLKGNYALTFWQNRPEKQEELYDLYLLIYEFEQKNIDFFFVQAYFYMICVMRKANKKGLNDEKILVSYDKLSEIISYNIQKNDTNVAQWEKVQDFLNQNLSSSLPHSDCSLIEKIFRTKFEKNPNDEQVIKKIYGILVSSKCTDSDLFFEIAKKNLFFQEKANTIDVKTLDSTITVHKAKFYLLIAQEELKKGNYPSAKFYALKAVSLDSSYLSKAYSFIGYLYLNSAGYCKGSNKNNPVHQKAIYIAAYNWFMKAGDGKGMSIAKSRFPTREEISSYNMAGKKIELNCWIDTPILIPTLQEVDDDK